MDRLDPGGCPKRITCDAAREGATAIYHYHVQAFSRSRGHSAVAAAAYRSRSRLRDERTRRVHDFRRKGGLAWSEILLPEGAPETFARRDVLWNQAETAETRANARVAREVRMALPRELSLREQARLTRRFLETVFVARGLGVDWNIHLDRPLNPHVHALLTVRIVTREGLGAKDRESGLRSTLLRERGLWAAAVNAALSEAGVFTRVDHRALRARGITRAPIHRPYAVVARARRREPALERTRAPGRRARQRNPKPWNGDLRVLERALNAGRVLPKPLRTACAADYAGVCRGRMRAGEILIETRDAWVLAPNVRDVTHLLHRPVRLVRRLRPGSVRGQKRVRFDLAEASLMRSRERSREHGR
ncbi:MAG: MobQ family relaxase [Acidiferrobacteraceae bacterium]